MRCRICVSEECARIDAQLERGLPYADIVTAAAAAGLELSVPLVWRHNRHHRLPHKRIHSPTPKGVGMKTTIRFSLGVFQEVTVSSETESPEAVMEEAVKLFNREVEFHKQWNPNNSLKPLVYPPPEG